MRKRLLTSSRSGRRRFFSPIWLTKNDKKIDFDKKVQKTHKLWILKTMKTIFEGFLTTKQFKNTYLLKLFETILMTLFQ